MHLYGLIGNPLTHSFSEKYFTDKFQREGITETSYRLFHLKDIEELPALLESYPDLLGLNVTIPYKKEVIPFLDDLEMPFGLLACNCIRIEHGRLIGYNTDWTAFLDSISPIIKAEHKSALILGNGGAAEAVVFALKQMDIDTFIVSREIKPGSDLTYQDLEKKIMSDNLVIVNTTPLGLYPRIETCPPIPYEFITPKHVLFDLVYNPAKTLFLQKGEQQGAVIKNGEEMLVMQAEESWKIWNT